MVSKTFFYKGLFVLLLLVSLLYKSFETEIIIAIILLGLLLVSKKIMLSKVFINLLAPLILIIVLSLVVGFFRNELVLINFLKDFLYLIKPILFLLIGYLFVQKINNKNKFFEIIIYTATFCAVFHILQFIIYILNTDSFSMNKMRPLVGLDNFLELFALGLIIVRKKYNILNGKNLRLITIILSISFILYFSRTMFALIIVVTLAFFGYLRISKKGLRYIFMGLGGLIAFYAYLFAIEIPRDSKRTLDNFLYKMKMAPSEVFIPSKSFDIRDHAKLWDHWRAYEANKAIKQLNEEGALAWSIGLGAGSLIDLGFYAPLSSEPEGMRYISNLHNGYAFVLYKTGLFGLCLYIIFLTSIYFAYKRYKYDNPLLANMIFAIVLFYIATSLIIAGIYNLSDIITLILGGVLFLSHKNYKES